MQSTFKTEKLTGSIRSWLIFFMASLVISGLTAMPAEAELSFAARFFDEHSFIGGWLYEVYVAVKTTSKNYPYLFYGYDWLAFAQIVLAIVFIGPYKDPVRNKWVIEFGAIACLLIVPFALFVGYFRGIPFWWRMIDCSFAVFGLIPLSICYNNIKELESVAKEEQQPIYSF